MNPDLAEKVARDAGLLGPFAYSSCRISDLSEFQTAGVADPLCCHGLKLKWTYCMCQLITDLQYTLLRPVNLCRCAFLPLLPRSKWQVACWPAARCPMNSAPWQKDLGRVDGCGPSRFAMNVMYIGLDWMTILMHGTRRFLNVADLSQRAAFQSCSLKSVHESQFAKWCLPSLYKRYKSICTLSILQNGVV